MVLAVDFFGIQAINKPFATFLNFESNLCIRAKEYLRDKDWHGIFFAFVNWLIFVYGHKVMLVQLYFLKYSCTGMLFCPYRRDQPFDDSKKNTLPIFIPLIFFGLNCTVHTVAYSERVEGGPLVAEYGHIYSHRVSQTWGINILIVELLHNSKP